MNPNSSNLSNLQILLTEDGSPTAFFEGYEGEKMHHSGGAFGETIYIFGPALQWGFSKIEKPRVISLGTGLAYNEIITAAFSLLFDQDYEMNSYEKDENLNENLKNWVLSKEPNAVYDLILQKTAELFEIPSEEIKNKLKEKLANGSWKILTAFPENPDIQEKFNVIMYDFFSSKAMSHFWSEEFLNLFLNHVADSKAVFATYACTGNLKRSLKNQGFNYILRSGFLWKKNSSFATRWLDH